MGNRKSSSCIVGIAAIAGKPSQNSVYPYNGSMKPEIQQKKWILSERDIAFLIAQTGK